MRLYNLAGVPTTVANMFVRVELARAVVPAFYVTPRRELEVKATVVGFLHFENGLMVSFTRGWAYWVVHLSSPVTQSDALDLNTIWSEEVRVDGYAGGTEPSEDGVTTYHVDTPAGLEAFVRFLARVNGSPKSGLPTGDLDSERVTAFTRFEAETLNNHPGMNACPAPSTPHQLADMNIDALLLLGGYADHIVDNHKVAIKIAIANFGAGSQRVRLVREMLATVLRAQIVLKNRYYSGPAASTSRSVSDSYGAGVDLFISMKLRVTLLDQIGRQNEARSVEAALRKVAVLVAEDLRRYIAQELKDLNASGDDAKVSNSMRDLLRYHCAYAYWKLADVECTLGNTVESELALALSESFAERLSPMESAHFKKVKAAD